MKFVHLHIPKTAGTSLRERLAAAHPELVVRQVADPVPDDPVDEGSNVGVIVGVTLGVLAAAAAVVLALALRWIPSGGGPLFDAGPAVEGLGALAASRALLCGAALGAVVEAFELLRCRRGPQA